MSGERRFNLRPGVDAMPNSTEFTFVCLVTWPLSGATPTSFPLKGQVTKQTIGYWQDKFTQINSIKFEMVNTTRSGKKSALQKL